MNTLTHAQVLDTLLPRVYACLTGGLVVTALTATTTMHMPGGLSLMAMILGFLFCVALIPCILGTRGWASTGLFGLFCAAEGLMIGPFVGHHLGLHPQVVVEAAILTVGMFGGLSAYVIHTRKDFTAWGGALFVLLLALLVLAITALVVPSAVATAAISLLGVVLFSAYILYDTSCILEKHWEADMYAAAALGLYLDVVNLFMDLVNVLAFVSDGD